MRIRLSSPVLAALLFVTATNSHAVLLTYSGALSGANEAVPVVTTGTGFVTVSLDTVSLLLSVNLTFSDLMSNTIAAHIHCCTSPGSNAPVASQLPVFVGFPLGVTSGAYSNTFDMTLASSYSAAFITANGGTVAGALATLSTGLEQGMAYFNIHTVNNPGGEIRANLVPEPGTVGMLLVGLGVLAAGRLKQTLNVTTA